MAILLLARSARLAKHASRFLFSRSSASASSFSMVTRLGSDCKRQCIFPRHMRHISGSSFAEKVNIQEKDVDDAVPSIANVASFTVQEYMIDGDIMHGDTNVKVLTIAETFQSNKCDVVEGHEMVPTPGNAGVIVGAKNVASTELSENDSSTVDTKLVENETKAAGDFVNDDNTPEFAIMHVAHLLGILEYENLTALKNLSGSQDEIFSNLSFLISVGFTEKQLIDTISMHPSLMTMDLNKSLNRVLKCLQKVELDASFLRQVLTVVPGLVPLLAKRPLQERVKALRELEFPDEDIGTLLKRLGTNQLERFLTLPVEKIEPAFTFLTDNIYLRNSEAIKLVINFPSVMLRDVEQDYASKLKVLKEVFAELKKAKSVFTSLPELLARKTDALEETLLCLKDMVKDAKKLSNIIMTTPSILSHRKSGIEQVSEFLQSLGFDVKASVSLIGREPYIVDCARDRLLKHVEFLRSKGFDENAIRSLMESSTGLFFRSLEKRVVPKINFLEKQGITGESLQKYVKSRPQVCDRSLKRSMNPTFDFLLSLGFEKKSSSLKNALKVVLPHSHKSLQLRVNNIIGLGIDAADVHKMVREEPSILVTPEAALNKRVNFLLKMMKRPVQDLVKCPVFLTSSIDRVVMPRWKVFEWLSSKGLLRESSLSALVETDEALFMKKYVIAHPEALSIYRGSPSVSS
ncbi:hypothetical protein GOP47_0017053 [Adiantum capillus-veneris]|uniref:Uncharacterized protein n=1 Tax=Adiantum capillus-veneris TaxID=13818 RepID=A0A9D4ZAW4_ADICA|nr:hypothetical protein GOP47_0017053 [Adiantum capillus-veneris]